MRVGADKVLICRPWPAGVPGRETFTAGNPT
jgi:hypothetical protein